jgi:hypothetical protein
MNLEATIKKIKYKLTLLEELQMIDLESFNINTCPSSCLINDGKNTFAISKWVSPKRTRSYPYERIYNTLNISKKITVIPVIKDEGAKGDRDFLQWDTISLMSLLDVFVIFAYYENAEPKGNKITNQKFNNVYVLRKLQEIQNFHSSALHWNLNEIDHSFLNVVEIAQASYQVIENEYDIKMHASKGISNFIQRISKDVAAFKTFSREKAKEAQNREMLTIQPKEALSSKTKAKLTITNYLGGQYFFTVDETRIYPEFIELIEVKSSKNSILPSKGDIKDGLLKMILYSNLEEAQYKAKLVLSSTLVNGSYASNQSAEAKTIFYANNSFNQQQIEFLEKLFSEANNNRFEIVIKSVE